MQHQSAFVRAQKHGVLAVMHGELGDTYILAFFEGLGRDFRANIVDFGHAEERAFVVFHSFGDVVTERRQTRLAAEVMVGITQLARFQGFGICLA